MWSPEDYDFKESEKTKGVWHKGYFELYMVKDRWLCRRRVKNKNGNREYLIRFFLPLDMEDKHIAEYLLTKGLE